MALREACLLIAFLLYRAMRFLLPGILLLSLPVLADDESDFSTAPDGTWLRYDPRALASLTPAATFDFGGNQCRINAPRPLSEAEYYAAGGFARAGLFAPSIMTDSVASVDVSDWVPSADRNLDGIHMIALTRVQSPIGLGSINGYAAIVIDTGANSGPGGVGRNGRLQLFIIENELPINMTFGHVDFLFDPAKDYRLILVSRGTLHTARVFDLANPASPVAEMREYDETYSSGRTGFMIYNDRVAPLDVTFDNFLAWDGTPPPLAITPGSDPDTIALSSDLYRSMATDLESTADFSDPLAPWQPAAPVSASTSGGQLITVFPIDGPARFFRRKSL
jgi:hypothetical protein